MRVIFHLDMDAFYASIEQRENPALIGKPIIVGSPPTQRGVVCAASYEARRFGIRSAMPSMTAGRLCPEGIFIPPRMDLYKAESSRIIAILTRTGAAVEQMSIDEAYLEVTEQVRRLVCTAHGGERINPDKLLLAAMPLARGIKESIRSERRLTATIGVATNKFLAKLGSDYRKPDGLTVIPESGKIQFLRPLPVRSIYGVGRVTEEALRSAGMETIGDVQDYPGDLRVIVGSFAATLRAYAMGEDDRPLELDETIRSISSEETFLRDTEDRRILKTSLRAQAEEVAGKLKRQQLRARTVQVKLRYGDFTTLTRQVTVDQQLDDASEIYRLACFLLAREKLVCRPLRLVGLGLSHLGPPAAKQLELW